MFAKAMLQAIYCPSIHRVYIESDTHQTACDCCNTANGLIGLTSAARISWGLERVLKDLEGLLKY